MCVWLYVCVHEYSVVGYDKCSLDHDFAAAASRRFMRRLDSSIDLMQSGHLDSSVSPVEQGYILNVASLIALILVGSKLGD